MAALTTQNIVYAGTAPTFAAATVTVGDTFETGPRRFAVIKNGSGAPIAASIEVPTSLTPYTQVDNDVEYTVAAGGESWIPLHSDYASSGNRTTIVCSAVTSVTVAAVYAGWTE
jgi:hypothetical protein